MDNKIKLYEEAKEAYYNGEPIMTDIEFDELEKELGLENKSYIGTKRSPNYTEKHPVKMGSLSKVQVKEDSNGNVDWEKINNEIGKFIKNVDNVIISPKYDGCSFEAVIKNGKIVSISSRGDGEYGKDLSNHLRPLILKNIKSIKLKSYLLRGEVLISREVFENKYIDNFVNPRSFVAGILGSDYSEDIKDKLNDLSIVIYDIKEISGNNIIEYDFWGFDYKDKPTFYFCGKWEGTSEQVEEIYKEFDIYRKNCPFALDGIVIKPIVSERENNYDDARPKDCVAVKFIPQLQETTVTEISWRMGKTHEMIPVVKFEGVEMDGKIIKQCSGHNYGYLIDNKVSAGTKIIVSLAGDIIPFLYKITNTDNFSEDKLNLPENCFIDGCHLIKKLSEEEIIKNDFLNSVGALNIPTVGRAGAESIFEYLNLNYGETDDFFGNEKKELPRNIFLVTPEDVYFGMGGGKRGDNAKKAFEKVLKQIKLSDIIKSCNFELCGGKAAEQVENYLLGLDYDFAHLPGVSYSWVTNKESEEYKLIENILNFLGRNFEDFKEFKAELLSKDSEKIPVILTGEPNDWPTKAEFMNHHPEYRLTGSWKEVKIVFTNSLESNTGKMKKAREKGIEIRVY